MPNPHPHFDDQGVLDWKTRYAEALAAAKAEGKLVFVELGRLQCSQCRTLVQNIVPRPDVAPILQERFIALAADADETEDEVIELAGNLEDAYMLPFVMFCDADGRFLAGSSGQVNPFTFASTVKKLAGSP
jgi:thioredoxin-related protein